MKSAYKADALIVKKMLTSLLLYYFFKNKFL